MASSHDSTMAATTMTTTTATAAATAPTSATFGHPCAAVGLNAPCLSEAERREAQSRLHREAADSARRRPEAATLDRIFTGGYDAPLPFEVERADSYTDDELNDLLGMAFAEWRIPPDRDGDFMAWACERFAVDPHAQIDLGAVAERARDSIHRVSYLMSLFAVRGRINCHNEVNIQCSNVFFRIFESIQYAYYGVESRARVINARDDNLNVAASLDSTIFRLTTMSLTDLKPNESLVLFLLRQLAVHGYRRYKGCCYEQILIEGPTPPRELDALKAEAAAAGRPLPPGAEKTKYETHAWRQVCNIEQFVYKVTKKEVHWEQWRNLNANGAAKHAVATLEKCSDIEFPDLVPDRRVFAFTTGLYDCYTLAYTPYVDPATGARNHIDRHTVACKFFDMPFPEQFADVADDWYADIATPRFQQVLDYQELGAPHERDDVCKWLYVMIGRMLYDVNEIDQWQVMPFIKGIAGSGKSTIIKVIQGFYPKADVATLSANCQEKFALESLLDCLIFVCSEVREDFGLSQGDLQSMISGEDVAANRKFKLVETRTWKAPGFFVGNQTGGWVDAQGSMTRRFIMWEFLRKVKDTANGKKVDPRLSDKIAKEMPLLLLKCNLAYRHACAEYADRDIWDVLPAYFVNTQRRLKAQINPLVGFLTDPETVEFGPDRYIYLKEFQRHYKEWLVRNNFGRPPKFVPDHYESVFEEYCVTVAAGPRGWDGEQVTGQWVVGVGLMTEPRHDTDSVPLPAVAPLGGTGVTTTTEVSFLPTASSSSSSSSSWGAADGLDDGATGAAYGLDDRCAMDDNGTVAGADAADMMIEDAATSNNAHPLLP
ncbi:D5 N terminal like incomplete domain containing protein [Pandoravirus salinus]|uniref:D5 N terminal like incomplete domain containing protein n=1 Tax=Pandoravirus salinus TaxID=1349410 RepID=S4W0L4_9VIRU|nr:D5 N terminal like incomplete domain [Pandoravirus salinus]AGO83917.1 D5 N terminal like incomplete domain containing protein [Pandoravirus salinus]